MQPEKTAILDEMLAKMGSGMEDKLQQMVYNIQLDPDIANMSAQDIFSRTSWRRVKDVAAVQHQRRLDEYHQLMKEAVDEKQIPIMSCHKCGHTDVGWDVKQTRSADEGSTVFCVCQKCQARWKM